MKKFLLIELPDNSGSGGGGGCIGVILIAIVIFAAITIWPKMIVELATGESGYNTAGYIAIIVVGLVPAIIVECVKKDADFFNKYLINAIVISLLMFIGLLLSDGFHFIWLLCALIFGAIVALVPTAVIGLIGKAIRK